MRGARETDHQASAGPIRSFSAASIPIRRTPDIIANANTSRADMKAINQSLATVLQSPMFTNT